MLERVEAWLHDLETWCAGLDAVFQAGQATLQILPILDRFYHIGYLLQESSQGLDQYRSRYDSVLQQWTAYRKMNSERCARAFLTEMVVPQRSYRISVEYFCKDLMENLVTRCDVLDTLMTAIEMHAVGLVSSGYKHIMLPAPLTSEDIPDRDMTDDLLIARRYLSIGTREVIECGRSVPEPMASEIAQLDRQLLECVNRVLESP